MDAAISLFLRKGYLSSSMDEVAAIAKVSKQTVYKHFADKDSLFNEIVMATIESTYDSFAPSILRDVAATDDLETGLRRFGRQMITALMQPEPIQMRRLVITEANRFPDLGRYYYERTYQRTVESLADALQLHVDKGSLEVSDAVLASHQFCWLIFAIPRNQVMLCGDGVRFTQAELHRAADAGVDTFLRAFARQAAPGA